MKIALICFHKNLKRYPSDWIDLYSRSILDQSYQDFDIYELNYGKSLDRIFEKSFYENLELPDHAEAHNYLVNKTLNSGYDMVLNTNVDDVYPLNRVQIQVTNYDPEIPVISGNYVWFKGPQKGEPTIFHKLNIDTEFKKGHNIIAHPACAYTKKFLDYNDSLRSNEIPADDFMLWKRLREKGANFKILEDVLLYYRISELKTNYIL
jgi:hypothetical protein